MLRLMNQITDKPHWHEKIFDEEIVSKWKAEALSADGIDITEKMVEWCMSELQEKAEVFKKTGAVSVYNGDVVKSDVAIPESLKIALKEGVASLENVRDIKQIGIPDLARSLVGLDDCIKRTGEGQTVAIPPEEETILLANEGHPGQTSAKPFSKQFQWLPCDVDITVEGAKITSYINNLHPELHSGLYSVIEQIIFKTIPLWNLTLSPLKSRFLTRTRIAYTECVYDPDPENGPATDGPQQEDGEDEDAYDERRQEWYEATRRVVQPEPGTFAPHILHPHVHPEFYVKGTHKFKPEFFVDLQRDYGHRGLQVIVKLANIHLTPENPEYEGGTWHVEGQMNEHICASAIYYYDSHNITTSRLAFRQQSPANDASDVSYEQDHHDWLPAVFGCDSDGPAVQDVGTVDTMEGRLLTWPNVLQHQVQPFRLADETKAGYRKILALFLVDPNIRIISTANVPCQQRDWWSDAIKKGDSTIPKLPVELQEEIFKNVEDFPIELQEAKELRLKLMQERKVYFVAHDGQFNSSSEFSLCEH
ncbi:hypothetical protein FPV67DRAFT_1696141 [Lyophyllum atratum]|nr:hypothetical protein FPV67DRAFT_1696141 [Lyophyllum atratum]